MSRLHFLAGRFDNPPHDYEVILSEGLRVVAESKRRAAHFSYVEEVDVTAIEELRAALNAREGAGRPRLRCCLSSCRRWCARWPSSRR
jgi:hypothetical protein